MALTFDLNPPKGGILIAGTEEELRDLSTAIMEAVEDGDGVIGSLLTDEGVEDLTVLIVEPV